MRFFPFIIAITFLFHGCEKSFKHFDIRDFEHISENISKNVYETTDELFNGVYILKIGTSERFYGGELLRVQDTTNLDTVVQYTYIVFDNKGRVFMDTYSEPRRQRNGEKIAYTKVNISRYIEIKSEDISNYSRHGFYRIVKSSKLVNVSEQKDIFQESRGKLFIEMELEKKSYKDKSILGLLFNDHRHFIIRAELPFQSGIIGDTLHIVDYSIPRKINPLRANSSVKDRYSIYDADEIFYFDLKFSKYNTEVSLNF